MTGRKTALSKKRQAETPHYCRECAFVTPLMTWNTLTVYGRKPTLGTCPYSGTKCVLLSQRSCGHFKQKKAE